MVQDSPDRLLVDAGGACQLAGVLERGRGVHQALKIDREQLQYWFRFHIAIVAQT